jgi:peptidoglycan/LPS O-acetylase OafA/YrhL
MTYPNARFWSVLASMRFLFAMWVLFDHTYNFGPADRAMPVLTKSGLMPVMCFFVISGFSIHHSIQNKPVGYLRRRFWRIFPLNALSVMIGWFAWSVLGLSGGYGTPQVPPTLWSFVGCLLLLEVFFPVMIEFLFPAWSLSIEAFYYLCAPLFKRLTESRLIPLLMIGSCTFFAAWPFIRDEYIAARYSYELAAIAMLWAWLAGWVAYSRPRDRNYLAALIVGGLIGIVSQAKFFSIVDFSSAAVTCVAWIGTLFVVFYRIGGFSGVAAQFSNYLGEISFPLYLLHYPILFVFTSTLFKAYPQLNYGYVQVLIAVLAAAAAYHYVDRPLRVLGSSGRIGEVVRRQEQIRLEPENSWPAGTAMARDSGSVARE